MTSGQRRLLSSVVCPGSRVRLTSACGRSRPCADPVSPAFPPTRRPAEAGAGPDAGSVVLHAASLCPEGVALGRRLRVGVGVGRL